MPDLAVGVQRITARAQADLYKLWRQVQDAVNARDMLADILPQIVDTYGTAAAAMAADWYDDLRAKSAVSGTFLATPAVVDQAGTSSLAGFAAKPLFAENPNWNAARTLADGGLQRRIANVARETVMQNAVADPQARGWQRVGNGSCGFCAMLIGRGAVYSERGADFSSHDHCKCSAAPAFRGKPQPVKPYTPSANKATDAERARVREYLRTH